MHHLPHEKRTRTKYTKKLAAQAERKRLSMSGSLTITISHACLQVNTSFTAFKKLSVKVNLDDEAPASEYEASRVGSAEVERAGAVSAGGESGGAVGSLCFGVLRESEGRVSTREYAGRGAARIALSPLAARTAPSPFEA
jgi:hypothetical protein